MKTARLALLAFCLVARLSTPVAWGVCIFGTFGNDIMNGTSGADCLDGNPGNDIIYGFAGDGTDYADGGPGPDRCEAETEWSCES